MANEALWSLSYTNWVTQAIFIGFVIIIIAFFWYAVSAYRSR